MEANENHALTKAESCYHCKPLVQQRNELAAQVERLREQMTPAVRLMRATGESSGWHEKAERIEEMLSETQPAALAALKAQLQAEAVDCCEKEVTASVNVLLKPHIAGVFAVIRQRAQEASDGKRKN